MISKVKLRWIWLFFFVYFLKCDVESVKLDMAISENSLQQSALEKHNKYRGIHKAGNLRISETLNDFATKCAKYYINRGDIDHTCPLATELGENLHMGTFEENDVEEEFVQDAIDGWYEEVEDYSFSKADASARDKQVEHFTQMIWKGSDKMGFGLASENGNMVAVALYSPQGNTEGEYSDNVPAPL